MSDAKKRSRWLRWVVSFFAVVMLMMCVWSVILQYTPTEGVAPSMQNLLVGDAFEDFPSSGTVAYRKGMSARDLSISVYTRCDPETMPDWISRHNGVLRQHQQHTLKCDLPERIMQEIGWPGPTPVDRSFVVQLPGGYGVMGEFDSASGWCYMMIGHD